MQKTTKNLGFANLYNKNSDKSSQFLGIRSRLRSERSAVVDLFYLNQTQMLNGPRREKN